MVFASKRVKKEFSKFNKKEREDIQEALTTLQQDPYPEMYQCTKLNKNKNVKRIRCKRARIFYMIKESTIYVGHMDIRNSKSYSTNPAEWFAAV